MGAQSGPSGAESPPGCSLECNDTAILLPRRLQWVFVMFVCVWCLLEYVWPDLLKNIMMIGDYCFDLNLRVKL